VRRPGLFEVVDDVLSGAFGDVAGRGDVAKAAGRVAGDGDQHAGVAGEEAPLPGLLVHDLPRSSMLTSWDTHSEFGGHHYQRQAPRMSTARCACGR
jgi:hypothetical protein